MTLLNQIWDFFASVKLAIFTLCTLAVTSIVGTVIPQGESSAYYVKQYGIKVAHFFQILDVPEMYYSWWFLGLLGILSTNLIICSIERFPGVWKIINSDNLSITHNRMEKMSNYQGWEFLSNQLNDLEINKLLKVNGWRNIRKNEADDSLFFCEKGKWSRTGVYIVHLSILIIFVGAILGHFYGFKGSVMIPENLSTEKAFPFSDDAPLQLGFEVRCNSFEIEFYENGMPKEYTSSLTVLENGEEVLTKSIEVNKPLTYKGITFYQSSYQGYQDFLFNITELSSGDSEKFTVPFQKQQSWQNKDIKFGIINADAIGQRVVRSKIWFKTPGAPATNEWIMDNDSLLITAGNSKYKVHVKQMYATGLQVAKDPGVWIVYIGCTLMLIGLFMAFFMSHQRIWLLLINSPNGRSIFLSGSANKNKIAFRKNFNKLVKQIDQQVSD